MGTRITKKRDPWHYTESGLENVFLIGIEVEKDPETGRDEPIIPHIEDLHQCIFLALICKPAPLIGREVRYMRRHLLWTQEEATKVLAGDQAYVSKRETQQRDTEFFKRVSDDFFWRCVCLRQFCKRANGIRKHEADEIRKTFLELLDEIEAKPEIREFRFKPKATDAGEIWHKAA